MSRSGDEAIVLDTLSEAGFRVTSVWDLVNSGASYRRAVPILLGLLPRVHDPSVKEGLVRALTVKEACGLAGRALADELKGLSGRDVAQNTALAWALGNALAEVVSPQDDLFDDLKELLHDQALGSARQMLTTALVKTRHPSVVSELLAVLPEPELTAHVLRALGRLDAPEALPFVEEYVDHSTPLIRREARKVSARLRRTVH